VAKKLTACVINWSTRAYSPAQAFDRFDVGNLLGSVSTERLPRSVCMENRSWISLLFQIHQLGYGILLGNHT
jgi:hypothetical protein